MNTEVLLRAAQWFRENPTLHNQSNWVTLVDEDAYNLCGSHRCVAGEIIIGEATEEQMAEAVRRTRANAGRPGHLLWELAEVLTGECSVHNAAAKLAGISCEDSCGLFAGDFEPKHELDIAEVLEKYAAGTPLKDLGTWGTSEEA